jgi:hypothetical protein
MTTIIYAGDRNSGKTRRCIERAAKTWSYIVCASHQRAHAIAKMATQLGLDIPFPITFDDFLRGRFNGTGNIKGFVIDDLHELLSSCSKGVPIDSVSWNSPTIETIQPLTVIDRGEEDGS